MNNIKKIVNSVAAYEILDSSNCAGSTWTSGGCAILAKALNKLEGYPIYVIYNKKYNGAEHFGVLTPKGSILDGDGEHRNIYSWLNFFKKNEIPRPGELVVIPFEDGVGMDGIKFDSEASDRLAELIGKYKTIQETVRDVLKKDFIISESNLNDNFYAWFGDSKVVDSSGNPLVVHHGTSQKFSKFNIKKSTQGLIWFTSNKSSVEAGEVGAQGRGYIMDLYAVVKNPAGWDEYDKYTLGQLESLGYDGAILPDSDGSITGFVFNPGQLKSVSNKGEWSKSNDNIFKEVIEEEIIDETYTGQKDLEKLSKDILFLLAKGIIKEKNHMIFLTDNPQEPITSIPLVNTLMMNGDGFSEISEFVESTNINISPTSTNIRGKESIQGELEYGYPNQFGESFFRIWLKYKKKSLDEINELFELYDTVEENDVYFKLFYMFYSTLLHELQHAYDAWRSNGKAFAGQLSKSFIDNKAKADAIITSKSREELTPEEIEAIQKSEKEYLNLVHEINARFAQALQKTSITTVNLHTYDDEMKPWDKVFSAFKVNFTGWNILSNKMKRKLTRRLSKAYYERSQTLKKGEDRKKEYEKEMEAEKEQAKKSISETRDIIREVLLEQKSERLINEAISLFEKEGDSPTFEWDIAQEKLDQSIENIFTGTQAKEYLIKFLDRIKSLPRQIKIRLAKYVATSLIGLIGIGTISNVFSGQASDIQKDVISSVQKEVNKSEFKAPTNVSNELIEFLKGEEGIGGKPVLTAYDIGDGAYTIGYGHAIFRNPNRGSTGGDYDFLPQYKNITPGKTRITPQQAETLLRDDVNEAKLILDDILNNWKGQGIRVEIDQQMYDAMVSMIYNMGREKFATSEFIQHVKKGDFISAAESIDKIDAPALLNKFPGLLNRRAGEKQIFSMNLHIPYEINESVIAEGVSPSEFTVAYFQKRIPFLKGYDIDYSPGDLSYQHGMEDRIQMSKNAMSKNVTIPFGDDLVTFPSVYISSDFFYYPHKVDENTFYVLGIKNKFSFMEPSNMNPLEFRVFNAAVHAKQEKEFSVIHEIMVHDGQEIPESEINTAINDINKKMFNLEDEISAWQIDNLF